ncbi:hypothetical protein GCM10010168_08450 [Actinoplanes ianthinogenes]|uniref:Uncharacterized protein n=1 Tax=Actinoplanes ianthinogenes TaxID=122358 RepID=A0ABN6CDH0_9ACTN|nr:hypothetical protein [Actinoplanes ianthinogenes]BCJ42413.1 hypothetical protein Aiant_30700 [Actinoplanes ianthinogenes]GGQ94823.1 hypothetical protein GCM10010168_08450 [Actinoplanes ianthinogenes]
MIEIDNLRRGLSAMAEQAEPVDLRDRALATSRRIRVRRTAATAAAGIAAVVVALSAAVAVRTDRPPAPADTPAPTAPAPTALPAEPGDAQPDLGPFDTATVTVPSWGSAADPTCPTGRITLTGGQYQRNGAGRTVNVLSSVAVDVDRDGVKDYVAHLMCGEGPEAGGSQIVAFRRDGRELKPIGRVVGTQDGIAMMDYVEARDGGRIAVLVSAEYTDGGQNSVPNQWRTYAWRDGRFRQVDGPRTFPPAPPAARLTVAASPLAFQTAGDGYTGRLTVTVRNAGAVDVDRLEILLVLPVQVRPTGAGWAGCVTRPGGDDTALVCTVAGPRARSSVAVPFAFVAAGKPVVADDPVNLGNHYVSISQPPPYDGQVLINEPEAIIPITVP